MGKFTDTEAKAQDESWERKFWPGGSDGASAQAALVRPGGYADVGAMYVRKIKQYRAVATLGQGCTDDDQVKLILLKRGGGKGTSLGRFECGSQVLLRGLDPGGYALYAVSNHQGGRDDLEAAVTGLAPFEIVDKNVAVSIPLQPIAVIEGQLVVPEGVAKPQVTPPISTRSLDVIEGAEALDETFLLWTDDRHFRLGLSPYAHRLTVRPFAGAHYVKEIRFAGAPLHDAVLPAGVQPTQKLEIVLTDMKSGVTGIVMDGSRPAANAMVFLVPEGRRAQDLADAPPIDTGANAQGRFTWSGAPGEYRVVAIARENLDRLNQPGVIDLALSSAQKVTVGSSIQNVEVRLLDPR